jgi:hypothetical protein
MFPISCDFQDFLVAEYHHGIIFVCILQTELLCQIQKMALYRTGSSRTVYLLRLLLQRGESLLRRKYPNLLHEDRGIGVDLLAPTIPMEPGLN